MPPLSRRTPLVLPLLLALLPSCRKGSDTQTASFVPVVPVSAGTQGCGPSVAAPGTATPVFNDVIIGPLSAIAAVAGSETLYLTGADGSIHRLDFPPGPGAPSDTVLLAPGTIEASYLVPAGIGAAAQLSGICVFDAATLIVAEHSSNSLLAVSRITPDTVSGLAGLPLAAGGNADGVAGSIRFHFTAPVPLLADASGVVFVGDTENHSLREVALGALPQSATVTGNGAPGASLGTLTSTQLDTPSGLAASCAGELLMVESGAAGFGGQRLISLAIGAPSILGGFSGSAVALAGDGTSATVQGIDTAAELAAPEGLVATQDGVYFWIDSATGILRRQDVATGLADCPLFADCAAAVLAGGSFSNGGHFSLALGDSGALYVLDSAASTLFRVEP